jgi:hypothetical protein
MAFFVPDGVCNPVRNVYDRFNVNAKSLKRLLRADVCSRRFIAYQVAKATTTSRHSLALMFVASVIFVIISQSGRICPVSDSRRWRVGTAFPRRRVGTIKENKAC